MDGVGKFIAKHCVWMIGLLLTGLVTSIGYINDLENRIIVLEAYTRGIAGTMVKDDG